MVYKKIGNKIPSLSSLLLAGVLLGSSCPSKKDKDGAAAEQASNEHANEESQVIVDKTGKVLGKDYLGVVKDIFTFLMSDVAIIDRLSNKPYQVNESDFQGKYAKDNLERLCSSFSNPPHSQIYPVSLQKCFSSLAGLSFRAAGAATGMQHKFAVGVALKHIIDFWADLHNIHKEAIALINKGAPEVQMGQLLNRLDTWFNEKVKSDAAVFKPEHKFYDSKKVELLNGDRLVRFLADKDANGQDKATKYNMSTLLKEEATDVWIIGYSNSSDERACKLDINNIAKRGAGIDNTWQVGGKATGLRIAPFPNYKADLMSKDKVGSGSSDSQPSVADGDVSGPIPEAITFGQFLTTLFNGSGKLDFIKLCPPTDNETDKKLQWFNIEGNNQVFQSVLNLVKQGSDAFADALGNHMKVNELKELFPIPDVLAIQNGLMEGIEGNIVNKGSSNQTGGSHNSDAPIQSVHIAQDSPAHHLLKNFVEKILGDTSTSLEDDFAKCKKCIDTNYKDYIHSNMSIDHKISLKVLKSLLEEKQELIILSVEPGSVNKLKEEINKRIIEEAKKAVVYKDGDQYKPGVSDKIRGWISDMGGKLAKKHSSASVTYKQIKDQAADFDINEVVKAMESDYNAVKGVITAKVGSFVQEPSLVNNENYKAYFPNLLLTATHVEHVNKMKSDYLNKSKSGAPAA